MLRPLAIGEVSCPPGDIVKSELLKRERLVLVDGLRLLEEPAWESLQQHSKHVKMLLETVHSSILLSNFVHQVQPRQICFDWGPENSSTTEQRHRKGKKRHRSHLLACQSS